MFPLGRTRKFIPPPRYRGWVVMEPLPRVFDMLQYFETILPSVEDQFLSRFTVPPFFALNIVGELLGERRRNSG